MKEIFYIENSISERNSCIRGYFSNLDDAKEALKDCNDWYRSKGTGRIYRIEFGLHALPVLVYEK